MKRLILTGPVAQIDLREDTVDEATHFVLFAFPTMQDEIKYRAFFAHEYDETDVSHAVKVAEVTSYAMYPGSQEEWLTWIRDMTLSELGTLPLHLVCDDSAAKHEDSTSDSLAYLGTSVKIYEITVHGACSTSETVTRFSLTPWNTNSRDFHGEDDGGRDYILPLGYRVMRDGWSRPSIYNSRGDICFLDSTDRKLSLVDSHFSPPRRIPLVRAGVADCAQDTVAESPRPRQNVRARPH
jgi:hypothetical protein